MPETYGYVRTSRPRVSEQSGSDPETQRGAVAGRRRGAFLTSIRTTASPEPPGPTAGGGGTLWTPG